ncbi:MAG: bifunctional metallophosphatase/5'-nucleotidase [Cytophagales bacterium]|nr:MAG: bifunctional metallophosphatase/5'-nucleotidase [Cytophagales bacterium]TAF59554.1 MAG: bifunctional metallophosphatase/5'-nucleotidase [Cytophagales bacterium]
MYFARSFFAYMALWFLLVACRSSNKNNSISFSILQINDVYEISPISNGKYGGLARIATLKKQLLAENPNTIAVLSGDFLSPSMLGNVEINGKKLRGKQMIAALNAAGIDLVTFGNHEFDLNQEDLLERIQESDFQWMSTNTFRQYGDSARSDIRPFQDKNGVDFPTHYLWKVSSLDQKKAFKLAFLGVTLPFTKKPHVHYDDYFEATSKELKKLEGKTDVVLALTHLNAQDDRAYARAFPIIPLLMGGHDHSAMELIEGNTRIVKADANAKTAYVHRCVYHLGSKKLDVISQKVVIGTRLAEDPAAMRKINYWKQLADSALRSQGFVPDEFLCQIKTPLEAQEVLVRSSQTNSAQLIMRAMEANMPPSDLIILGGGAIRLDDVLHESITQYDVLRLLPFGGAFLRVHLKGSLLEQILNDGEKNSGTGGYLQRRYAEYTGDSWKIRGKALNPTKTYTLVINDYLMTGQEKRLGYLTPQNKDVVRIDPIQPSHKDIRKTLIAYLRKIKIVD